MKTTPSVILLSLVVMMSVHSQTTTNTQTAESIIAHLNTYQKQDLAAVAQADIKKLQGEINRLNQVAAFCETRSGQQLSIEEREQLNAQYHPEQLKKNIADRQKQIDSDKKTLALLGYPSN